MDVREMHPALVIWLVLVSVMGLTWWSQSWGPRGEVDDRNYRNFPPPELVFQGATGEPPTVTLTNASPEAMTLILTSADGEDRRITLPRCEECRYATVQTSTCEGGDTLTYALPAGTHEVKARFGANTRGFESTWNLAPGSQYDQCFTLIFGDFPGGPDQNQDFNNTTTPQIDP